MRIVMSRLIKNESGQAMILAVILLLVSGLVVSSLLSYMGTGLVAGRAYETRAVELYAADAGVEDAVWKIQNPREAGYLPCSPGSPPRLYNITDVNGKGVQVTIQSVYAVENMTFIYRVLSTATGSGSGTEIEAYVDGVNKYGDYAGLLGQVLTSQSEIVLKPGTEVYPSEGEHSPMDYYGDPWPTAEELTEFYLDDVAGEESYGSDIMILNSNTELGPLYRDGELEIKSNADGITVTLNGTICITGDTLIGATGKEFILDLNDCTIFVASNSSDPQKALWIGGKCTIVGSGVIIAIGDMYFEPNTEAGVTDPIFVMSVLGTSHVQPGGDFYGSIAGSVEIDLYPGTSINYPTEEEGWYDNLNFLTGVKKLAYSITSWEVSQV
jgi:hypothetical protein